LSALAPFRVRSFRFQWPADLATSWAFEMEALILGWYVLATTGSVQLLVVVGALAWLGSLFAPFFGIAGDRIGVRRLLCLTRGGYALLAALLAWLTLSGRLEPWHVLVVAGLAGLMKPSDMAMRHVLVGHTIPSDSLMGALAISRTTSDTARIFGAIAGTGGVALVGMGQAYAGVSLIYVGAFLFSLGVAPVHASSAQARILTGLKAGVRYVWEKPDLLGAFSIAFLVNFLAYPFFLGLLPYVAKNVYGMEQSGLGWLAGAFAVGALAGSLVVSANRLPLRAARVMLLSSALWFVLHPRVRPGAGRGRGHRDPLSRRLRAELLHDADRRGHAARVQRRDARARDGHPHACDLGATARARGLGADHRRVGLCGDHADLRRAGARGDDRNRLPVATGAVADVRRRQRASLGLRMTGPHRDHGAGSRPIGSRRVTARARRRCALQETLVLLRKDALAAVGAPVSPLPEEDVPAGDAVDFARVCHRAHSLQGNNQAA
jgi:MFS family permease